MIEIERKFLVTSNAFKTEAFKSTRIIQGYLNSNKNRAVRVRIKGEQGFLTIKGASSKNGLSRFEWEKEIPRKEAQELLNLCEPGVIDKTRYEVKVGPHIFEVDTFYGDNEGLIIAEVELKNENETFEKPNWLGEEVSGQIKYYNSQLSNTPFNTWDTSCNNL
ncbi:CYTH domain-containing protein [Algibacter pectinivorans]|uniref:CYTH domain-containing protein n=1 Tax=Algibacter pectinivorans TaxID=870482 RepID=A0A1I1NL10_9FLAO|nr:CYTH domain-containing protein [Algibacter pectinivorans]SFC98106.1 CYTH domain-containing protein [Algibacter pectinivorans]